MRASIHNDFLSKLDRLSAGRAITPWLAGLGITAGTLTRIKQGQTPSTDFLTALQRFENTRLDWLVSGHGSPYLVTFCEGEAACLYQLAMLLEDEPGWKIHVVADAYVHAYVLTQPATHRMGNKKPIPYTAIEVIAGVTPLVGEIVGMDKKAWHVTVDETVMDQLQAGQLGTYQLVGDDRHQGILAHAEQQPAEQALSVGEKTGEYRYNTDLHQLVDALQPQQARALESFLRASVHAEPMFLGSEYQSRHGSNAQKAKDTDEHHHHTHGRLPHGKGRAKG